MNIRFQKNISDLKADGFIFFFCEDEKNNPGLLDDISKKFKFNIEKNILKHFHGKEKESVQLYCKGKRIIFYGIGKLKKINPEKIRKALSGAVEAVSIPDIKSIAVELIDYENLSDYEVSMAQCESLILTLYKFDKYKTGKTNRSNSIRQCNFFSLKKQVNETLINKGIREAKIISESVCFARDIGNEPSSVIFPEALSEIVKDRAKKYNFQLQVLNKEEILKQKMGGVIAVSKGSTNEPRFLILKYLAAPGDNKPVVLIGKGVTFDSGGISLKPGTGMSEMKMDMCGAAAVIAAVEAAARLKLKVNIIGLVPLVENMPDGSALKPGDIVKSHNGKYIEVDNTDAEGRIILADALSFAGTFKPSYVVDLATLTGAAIIVLGHIGIPAMGNDPVLLGKFKKAGEETYERIWELPLWDEYDRMIEADTGDVLNVGPPRQAGTIIAGTFLKKFIGNYKWLHLDIAGTAIMPKPSYYISKNASGSGVRLLVRFLFNELNL